MDSKALFLALFCLLAINQLVQGNNDTAAASKPAQRYKRMYVMCPPAFSQIGNECYYISENKFNWLDAYFECKDRNSKLAEPMKFEDRDLRRYLQKIKLRNDLWIGGTYNWKTNKWQWGHNGREIEYQSFSQMVPGSSQDLKFNCALLRSDHKFRWSAEECTKKINFICQHRMPLVSEVGRNNLYDKWNKTYPYQKANEKMVYIVNDRGNRNRNDTTRPHIYPSFKKMKQSNPSIRPSRRRNPYRTRKPFDAATNPNYIPADVVARKQQVAQYVPDTQNELNTIDNGHRNGYTSQFNQFNIDFNPRNGKGRNPTMPRRYRTGYETARVEPQHPHQHRHQPGMHKTTKHTHQHPMLSHPMYVHPPTMPTTTTTSTTTTTTTTTPPPPPKTTMRPSVFPPATTSLSPEERKLKREKLRERLQKLTVEEQQFFMQNRANRKRKEQLLRKLQQQRENEVVQ
ncbi:uncharacterized protein LOC128726980 [Anopheles nili]|uniref:uncharacterized protein LOC128726980 n=1 Tax=Anopheles nili TaxID=185578 RepID=UPI00237C0D62|nr:uncharacterized protein LOC128726980 [Anopheles nili]